MTTERAESRCHCLDSLRVFAAFAVMMLHVASQYENTADIHSFDWQAMNFWNSMVRWTVPVFVMISGALFLSRDIPVKKIYTKYIFRIFTAFLFWSFFYACREYAKNEGFEEAFKQFLTGYYHMWFLYMIMGMYAIIPFVKKIAESEKLTKYFLVMAFVIALVLPETISIIQVFSDEYGKFGWTLAENLRIDFVCGFTVYFLLGYFLNNAKISPKAERLIYAAGIAGFAATMLMTLCASLIKEEALEDFYYTQTVNVMCEAVAVFVFFRERLNFPVRFMRALSQYSFGAYLLHPAVMEFLAELGLDSMTFTPAVSIPIVALAVFVISFIISAILNHIPVLKKYIV